MKNSKDMYGADDWLAREIRRESRVSAWDLDNAAGVRREHEENCDAEQLAREHRIEHAMTQHEVPRIRTAPTLDAAPSRRPPAVTTPDGKKVSPALIILGIIFLPVLLVFAPVLLPIGIFVGIAAAAKKNQKQ